MLIVMFRGPVWVYILERKRAVEVWNSLMGARYVLLLTVFSTCADTTRPVFPTLPGRWTLTLSVLCMVFRPNRTA